MMSSYLKIIVVVIFFTFILSPCAFCDEESGETFTITTYYPSPYGSYNELSTRKMVIGDTDAPDTSGVIRFEGRINNPSGANDTADGAMYYNNSNHEFKYYDSSIANWKAIGSSVPSGMIAMFATACPTG